MEKVLLIDVAAEEKYLAQFSNFGLTVDRAQDLTQSIINWPSWSNFDPATTCIVMPGNGANIVYDYLPKDWLAKWQYKRVYAKRYWLPGQDPRIVANRIWPDRLTLNLENIIILDDVISSGGTCRTLRSVNLPWIPKARWHAVAWLMQKSACLRGLDSCFAAKAYGTKERKAPINSLSTLLSDKEIASSYAQRNFRERSDEFLALLK